jgi:hypothetical protein
MSREEQNAVSIKIYDGSWLDEAALVLICEYQGSVEVEGRPELSLLEEAELLLSVNEKRWSVPQPAGERLAALISYVSDAESAVRLDCAHLEPGVQPHIRGLGSKECEIVARFEASGYRNEDEFYIAVPISADAARIMMLALHDFNRYQREWVLDIL